MFGNIIFLFWNYIVGEDTMLGSKLFAAAVNLVRLTIHLPPTAVANYLANSYRQSSIKTR